MRFGLICFSKCFFKNVIILFIYSFEIKRDLRSEIQNSIAYRYKDPKISIIIDNSFYDSNPSYNETSNSMISVLNATESTTAPCMSNAKKTQKKKNKSKPKVNLNDNLNAITVENSNSIISQMSISNLSIANDISSYDEPLVRVTHIKSPENFYIQNEKDIESIRQLSHTYLTNNSADRIPKLISVGYYYMAYHVTDKQWYRGMLKKILSKELYKIFLVDFGINMEVTKDK